MKVVVYGYGSIGKRHARNARSLGHDVCVEEFDDAARRAAVHDGFRLNLSDVNEETAVIIATPAHTHDALMARHEDNRVFVEKPMLLSAPDWAPSSLVHVGYNLRFLPDVMGEYRSRDIGAVTAHFYVSVDGTTWPGAHYADTLLECSHEIDLALHLCGPAQCTHAQASRDQRAWQLSLRHDSGVITQIHLDTIRRGDYLRFADVVGTRGTHRWSLSPSPAIEETYRQELIAFFAAIDGDVTTPACTFEEARQVLVICDAAKSFVHRQLMPIDL